MRTKKGLGFPAEIVCQGFVPLACENECYGATMNYEELQLVKTVKELIGNSTKQFFTYHPNFIEI